MQGVNKVLPNEVWGMVLSNLDVQNQSNSQMVCKGWHKIIEEAHQPITKNDFWASQLLPEIAALPQQFISPLGGMHAIYMLPQCDVSPDALKFELRPTNDVSIMRTRLENRAGLALKIFSHTIGSCTIILNTNDFKSPTIHNPYPENHLHHNRLKYWLLGIDNDDRSVSHNAIALSEENYPLVENLIKDGKSLLCGLPIGCLDSKEARYKAFENIFVEKFYYQNNKGLLLRQNANGGNIISEEEFILLCEFLDLNTTSSIGNTALHWALQSEQFNLAMHLIAFGARIDLCNMKGKTALDLIQESGQEVLLEAVKKFSP